METVSSQVLVEQPGNLLGGGGTSSISTEEVKQGSVCKLQARPQPVPTSHRDAQGGGGHDEGWKNGGLAGLEPGGRGGEVQVPDGGSWEGNHGYQTGFQTGIQEMSR